MWPGWLFVWNSNQAWCCFLGTGVGREGSCRCHGVLAPGALEDWMGTCLQSCVAELVLSKQCVPFYSPAGTSCHSRM